MSLSLHGLMQCFSNFSITAQFQCSSSNTPDSPLIQQIKRRDCTINRVFFRSSLEATEHLLDWLFKGWYEKHPVHLAVSNDLLNQGLIHYLPSGVRLQSKVHIILDHFALKIFAALVLLASESRRSWITLYFLCLFSRCSGFSTALWKCSQYQFQK